MNNESGQGAPTQLTENQCMGCQAGWPINNGIHDVIGGYPGEIMSCTSSLYSPSEQSVASIPQMELHELLVRYDQLWEEAAALRDKLNAPELLSFRDGVVLEAAHQRERWGSGHDAGKEPQDWFWLAGYLSGKALRSHIDGNAEKALHHTISSAAALANWHAAILGANNVISAEKQPDASSTEPQSAGGKEAEIDNAGCCAFWPNCEHGAGRLVTRISRR